MNKWVKEKEKRTEKRDGGEVCILIIKIIIKVILQERTRYEEMSKSSLIKFEMRCPIVLYCVN